VCHFLLKAQATAATRPSQKMFWPTCTSLSKDCERTNNDHLGLRRLRLSAFAYFLLPDLWVLNAWVFVMSRFLGIYLFNKPDMGVIYSASMAPLWWKCFDQ
jgi:hypothetical protein